MSLKNKILCLKEPGYFPEEEFIRDKKGRLVHKRGVPHFATGEDTIPLPNMPEIPGLDEAPPPLDLSV